MLCPCQYITLHASDDEGGLDESNRKLQVVQQRTGGPVWWCHCPQFLMLSHSIIVSHRPMAKLSGDLMYCVCILIVYILYECDTLSVAADKAPPPNNMY